MVRVDFGPNMIFCVPDPSNTAADGTAEHAEAVGPLSNTSASGLEQPPHIAIARESFVGTAALHGASIQFNP